MRIAYSIGVTLDAVERRGPPQSVVNHTRSTANAVTHATATEVQLTLKLNEEGVSIAIADNGNGFDPDSFSSDGNGLQNMRRRLQDIGGRLEINSRPGQGTTILLFVPEAVLHGRVIGGNGVSSQES